MTFLVSLLSGIEEKLAKWLYNSKCKDCKSCLEYTKGKDVFKNFRNKWIKTYELYPAHYLTIQELTWQAWLKKPGTKLEWLTNTDMLQMVGKWIEKVELFMQAIDM